MQQQTSFLDLLSGKTCPEPLAATREKTSKPSSKRFVASGGGQDHIVPMPPKDKWTPAGCIVGDGWSVAWRVYDAQYWGVPQRRKRIYLIADFRSERAGEILFECESVRGDSAESGEARQGIAADVERSAGRSDCVKCLNPWDCQSKRQYSVDGVYRTLDAGNCAGGQAHGICYPAAFMGGQGAKARSIAYCKDGTTPTLKSAPSGGNTVPDVVYPINTMVATRGGKDDMRTCFGVGEQNDPQFTISAAHEHAVCYSLEGHVIDRNSTQNGCGWAEGYAHTLNATDRNAVCYGIDQQGGKGGANYQTDVMPTLCSDSHGTPHAVCFRKSSKPGAGRSGERWVEDDKTNTLNTFEFHSEVRTPEVVAIDCRNMCANVELSGTLQAKNQGGHSLNYINPVCYPIENHPADSRIELLGGGRASSDIDKPNGNRRRECADGLNRKESR